MLARLAADEANAILRVAVIRQLHRAGELSHAVSIAFDLDESEVASATDRALVAQVFDEAGMADDAAIWHGAAPDTPPPSPDPVASPAVTPVADPVVEDAVGDAPDETEADPSPHVPPIRPDRHLRLVGEEDAAPAEVEAPFTFASVGGLDKVKQDIRRRIIAPFQSSGLIARFRRKGGGGVLLYGPPGCGKTLLARATAGECNAKFHAIHASDILRPLQGESEAKLAAAFATARSNTPSVLFIDEIDALASRRSEASSSHVAQLVSVLLTELDGIASRNDGVLVLAATNLPWSVDPAFLRPGRFDRLFFVPPPDRPAREAILQLELSDQPQVAGLDLAGVAAKTTGLSGADLADIVARAGDIAIDATLESGRETPIDQKMLNTAMAEVNSSVTDWLTTARNYATYANESGRYDDVLAFLKSNGR